MRLAIFHFGSDEIGGRMGTPYSYAVGVDEAGRSWRSWDAVPDDSPAPIQTFQDVRFRRTPDLDGTYPMKCILEGDPPFERRLGEFVSAGMGNFGSFVGILDEAQTISDEAAAVEAEELVRSREREAGRCDGCSGEGTTVVRWTLSAGEIRQGCLRCSGTGIPPWLRAEIEEREIAESLRPASQPSTGGLIAKLKTIFFPADRRRRKSHL